VVEKGNLSDLQTEPGVSYKPSFGKNLDMLIRAPEYHELVFLLKGRFLSDRKQFYSIPRT
jgi:hypothetical protein